MSLTIKPSDINTDRGVHFWNAFGECNTEVSAKWVVRFCQDRDKSAGKMERPENTSS